MEKQYDIKYVAMYLRKSRGDEEKDLENHRMMLKDLCAKHDWKYVEHQEIGTSDSIDMRPKMKQLLSEVTEGIYDAVCVVDYDRLSRGDLGEQDRIKKVFSKNNTFIVTPSRIYDLTNDDDEFVADIEGLVARREYKMIKKRLGQGKKVGARRGNWTNGTPPFPYEYETYGEKYNEKGLVVNDDKLVVYRFMLDASLNGTPPYEIAWELNKQGILSPRGKSWSNVTIYRMLKDETHLGRIISNKGSGDSHITKNTSSESYKRNARSEWVIVENCHQPVKTISEHNTILEILNKRTVVPTRARTGTYTFSGLIKCKECGHGLTFYTKPNGKEYMKPCWYKDEFGNKCTNGGTKVDVVEEIVKAEILILKQEILAEIEVASTGDDKKSSNRDLLNQKIRELEKYETAMDRVNDAYDIGDYSRDEWLERKEKWESKISKVEEDINIIEAQINNKESMSNDDRLRRIDYLLDHIDEEKNPKERNVLYKSIIDNIVWGRTEKDNIYTKVNFL